MVRRCFLTTDDDEAEEDESRVEDEVTKRSSWTRSTLVTRIASILKGSRATDDVA